MFAAMNIQINNHIFIHITIYIVVATLWKNIMKQLKLNIIQLHTFARTKHLHSFVWEYIRFAGMT